MLPKSLLAWCCVALASSAPLHAAVSLGTDAATTAALPTQAVGPAQEALEAFRAGRLAKAVELARPLADKGNPDAGFLMGFAYETGQGIEGSRDKAIEYYRKAGEAGHKESVYRAALLLLASDDEAQRTQGRKALEGAAKDDPATAGRILGEAFLRARLSKEPDVDNALFWWGRAADAGDVSALVLMARFYDGEFGFPEKKDAKKAVSSLSKAAGLGNAPAMAMLGSRLLNGAPEIRNEKEGREWLKKAVDSKEYSACLALGDYEEREKKNLKAALAEYEKGDIAGQVDCTLRAAVFYQEGKGVEKDVARAKQLLEKAAKAGSPAAHFALAADALSGEKPDLSQGYVHLLSAANGGMTQAQNELALIYLGGKLGAADSAAGVAWLTRAAQGGFAPAQNSLAALFESGNLVPRNLNNAAQLYTLAAQQGHGPATFAIARMFGQGVGTTPDPVKAWAFSTVAGERGVEEGKKYASELDKNFTESQRGEAKKFLEDLKSGKAAAKDANAKPKEGDKAKPAPVNTPPGMNKGR